MTSYDRECLICGKAYTAKRKHAKYCGSGCRAKWSMMRKTLKSLISEPTEYGRLEFNKMMTEICKEAGVNTIKVLPYLKRKGGKV